ncbi:hypothetical protein CFI09_21490 [Escherichia coli]|nr:hypothetical protein CFI09_21490 [Escherichia coli]
MIFLWQTNYNAMELFVLRGIYINVKKFRKFQSQVYSTDDPQGISSVNEQECGGAAEAKNSRNIAGY